MEQDRLYFDKTKYVVRTLELEGREITYRAYEDLVYCRRPVDPIQKMNIFVPDFYYTDARGRGHDLRTAPIFMPNTVGGYMPGPADRPGYDAEGRVNAIFCALEHGYVVASPGIRGRSSGRAGNEYFKGGALHAETVDTGRNLGKAPALIVDLKAAVRYLRYNKERIPGDTDHIITNGTSAGGALSAMGGATGNSEDYEPYLKEIGAAEAPDDIFAASCYCPVHNLEHSDMAYEWQFAPCRDYYHTRQVICDGGLSTSVEKGIMSDEEIEVSSRLKDLFPEYLNSLGLRSPDGEPLRLSPDGKGSFLDYVKLCLRKSAQLELACGASASRLRQMGAGECPVQRQAFLEIRNGQVVSIDWELYVRSITRMKTAPAFDGLDLSRPENKEFGESDLMLTGKSDHTRATIDARHFTEFSYRNSTVGGEMAEESVIRMINPIYYVGQADTCRYWRIRHGMFDRDTSVVIPMILALTLENQGYSVDFEVPWGMPHSGDYDLDELFEWIDDICSEDAENIREVCPSGGR